MRGIPYHSIEVMVSLVNLASIQIVDGARSQNQGKMYGNTFITSFKDGIYEIFEPWRSRKGVQI